MDRRTRENLLYVGEELVSRFGKPVCFFFLVLGVGVMIAWGFQKVDAYLTPSFAAEESKQEEVVQGVSSFDGTEAYIVIPKIQVEAPIRFVQSTDPHDFLKPLKEGVAHYPSALPGQKGASILLGHSAPLAWFGHKYDDVFSNLKDLEQGDRVSVRIGGDSYVYEVSGKFFLNRGQDMPQEFMQSDHSRILLISCWPPGINNKRIMVQADEV